MSTSIKQLMEEQLKAGAWEHLKRVDERVIDLDKSSPAERLTRQLWPRSSLKTEKSVTDGHSNLRTIY